MNLGWLTPSLIFAMKSRGFPWPLTSFDGAGGTGFAGAERKIWSRKRYAAARTTPSARMETSWADATGMMGVGDKPGRPAEPRDFTCSHEYILFYRTST